MPLSATDRDYIVRTVLGEAADEPEEGQRAVAHVISNRLNAGSFGKTGQEIVLAPNQFEPWSTRAAELRAIDPRSPQYVKTGQLVDQVFGGKDIDPTGGATHFLQPDIVAARGTYRTANGLPDWAQGPSVRVGSQLFYAPANNEFKGTIYKPDLLGTFAQRRNAPVVAQDDTPDLLGTFAQRALREGMTPNKPVDPLTPSPENRGTPQESSTASKIINRVVPGLPAGVSNALSSAINLPSDIDTSAHQFQQVGSQIQQQGAKELGSGVYFPYAKSLDPSTWEAGGILNYGRGALTQALSYPFGAIDQTVTQPGNKIAPGVGDVLSSLIPLGAPGPARGAARVARPIVPSNRAVSEIVNRLPDNQLHESITRMESNPRLSLVDVAPEVRITAQGMVDPGQPGASGVITSFAKKRKEEAPGAVKQVYESAIGKSPDPLQRLDEMKAEATKVGDKLINPAIEGAGPVDITSVVKHLTDEIGPYAMGYLNKNKQPPMALSAKQEKAIELLQDLRGKQIVKKGDKVFMDASILNEKQSDWRKMAEAMHDSSNGMDRYVSPLVSKARDKLVDAIDKAAGEIPVEAGHTRVYMGQNNLGRWYTTDIDKAKAQGGTWGQVDVPDADMTHFPNPRGTQNAVPAITENMGAGSPGQQRYFNAAEPNMGAYRKGLTKYREAMQVPEAFERGLGVEQNRAGMKGVKEDSPQAWQRWVKDASPAQLEAARDGARWAIDRHIEMVRKQKGINLPESNFMGDKIKILFGEKEGTQLINHLKDERDIAATNTKLIDQSKTAETLAGKESMKPTEVGGPSGMIAGGLGSIAAPLIGAGLGFPGHGAIAGATILGMTAGKNLTQRVLRMHDLARNKQFARYATATGEDRNALIDILKGEATKRFRQNTNNRLQSILSTFPR